MQPMRRSSSLPGGLDQHRTQQWQNQQRAVAAVMKLALPHQNSSAFCTNGSPLKPRKFGEEDAPYQHWQWGMVTQRRPSFGSTASTADSDGSDHRMAFAVAGPQQNKQKKHHSTKLSRVGHSIIDVSALSTDSEETSIPSAQASLTPASSRYPSKDRSNSSRQLSGLQSRHMPECNSPQPSENEAMSFTRQLGSLCDAANFHLAPFARPSTPVANKRASTGGKKELPHLMMSPFARALNH